MVVVRWVVCSVVDFCLVLARAGVSERIVCVPQLLHTLHVKPPHSYEHTVYSIVWTFAKLQGGACLMQ